MRTAFAAGLAALAAACGASPAGMRATGPEPASGGDGPPGATAPAGAPAATLRPGDPAGAAPSGRGPAASSPASAPEREAPTQAPTAPSRAVPSNLPDDAPLTVRVAADCVVPGGTQRVVVDTLPEAYVAYDNLYADSRDGAVHGGIDGQARSDARGHFEAVWVVARTAPLGDVRLDVAASAQGRGSVRMVFYRVASTCP